MVKTTVRNLKFTVNLLIQIYIFMLSQAILIRLKNKEAVINNIFQRAYKLCDPQFLDHKIKFIYKIFKNL